MLFGRKKDKVAEEEPTCLDRKCTLDLINELDSKLVFLAYELAQLLGTKAKGRD